MFSSNARREDSHTRVNDVAIWVAIPSGVHEARSMTRPRRLATWISTVTFIVVWGLTTHGKYSVTGDEPHYLLMTQSLAADGDLDLANNYAAGSSALFGHDNLAQGLHARIDQRGRLTSVHEPGLAFLVLPVYAISQPLSEHVPLSWLKAVRMTPGLFTYSVISLFMNGLTAISTYLLVLTVASRSSGSGAAVGFAAMAALSPPVLSNAFTVFPEIPGLLIAATTMWATFGPGRESRRAQLVALVAIGLLPWFHRKFTIFALGLAFVLVGESWRRNRRVRWPDLACSLLPALLFYGYSLTTWGTFRGPVAADGMPFSLEAFLHGAPGLLIDRENGLFVWAPLYLPILAAFWLTRRELGSLLVPLLALFLPCAAHVMWWGGFSPVGRFLVPLVPLAVLAVGEALGNSRALLRSLLILTGPQLAIDVTSWMHPRILWPSGDGHNRLFDRIPLAGDTLASLLPSFRTSAASVEAAAVIGTVVVLMNCLIVRSTWLESRRSPS